MSDSPAEKTQRAGRGRSRLLLYAAGTLCLVIAMLGGALSYFLGNLESPIIQDQIRTRVEDSSGADFSYGPCSFSLFEGIRCTDIRIKTPDRFRAHSEDFVKIEEFRVRWTAQGLMNAPPTIEELHIGNIEITLLEDEKGTTVDEFKSPPPSEAKPKKEKKSRSLYQQLTQGGGEGAGVIEKISIGDLRVRHLVISEGSIKKDSQISGLGVLGELKVLKGAPQGRIHLGTFPGGPEARTVVKIIEEIEGIKNTKELKSRVINEIVLQSTTRLRFSNRIEVYSQNFVEDIPALQDLFHADLAIEVKEEGVFAKIESLGAIEGALRAKADLRVGEPSPGKLAPLLERFEAEIDLDELVSFAPRDLATISLKEGKMGLVLSDVSYAPDSGPKGTMALKMSIPELDVVKETNRARVEDLSIDVHGDLSKRKGTFSLSLGGSALKHKEQAAQIQGISLKISGAEEGDSGVGTQIQATVDSIAAQDSAQALDTGLKGISIDLDVSPIDPLRIWSAPILASLNYGLQEGRVELSGRQIELGDLNLKISTEIRSLFDIDLKVATALGGLGFESASDEIAVHSRALNLDIDLANLKPNLLNPIASKVQVQVGAGFSELNVQKSGERIRVQNLEARFGTDWTGATPYELQFSMPIEEIGIGGAKGAKVIKDAEFFLQIAEVYPDLEDPVQTRAKASAKFQMGKMKGDAQIDKRRDEIEYGLSLSAPNLRPIRPWIPKATLKQAALRWSKLGLKLKSSGMVRGIKNPDTATLSQTTQIDLKRFESFAALKALKIAEIRTVLRSEGNQSQHEIDVDIEMHKLQFDAWRAGLKNTLELGARVNLPKRDFAFNFKCSGGLLPFVELAAEASYKGPSKRLKYKAQGELKNFLGLHSLAKSMGAPRIPLNLAKLSLAFNTQGKVANVIRSISKSGDIRISRQPLKVAVGEQDLRFTLRGIDVEAGASEAQVESLEFNLESSARRGQLHVDLGLSLPRVRAVSGENTLVMKGFTQSLSLKSDSVPGEGLVTLKTKTSIENLSQDAMPLYKIGDFSLDATLLADHRQALRIKNLEMRNPLGGTHLTVQADLRQAGAMAEEEGEAQEDQGQEATVEGTEIGEDEEELIETRQGGSIDQVPGGRRLALNGTLKQDFRPLGSDSDDLAARGQGRIAFSVESGDLSIFHMRSTAHLEEVDIELPAENIAITGMNGSVPLEISFRFDPLRGLRLLQTPGGNSWTRWRFQDQHPFLRTDHFLAIDRARKGALEIGPIGGNMRLDQNVFHVDQLELQVRGGRIVGQCLAALQGVDTEVNFRGNITGFQPSTGRGRLDANAALRIVPAKMDMSGRVQALTLDPQHLLDLLELQDPYHEDVQANLLRKALKYGYPKSMRLKFQHGFMDGKVELGGVASIVEIGEIRGVAVGPMLQRFLGPIFEEFRLQQEEASE